MSFEDWLARVEGLSPEQIAAGHAALVDAQRIATTVRALSDTVETEIERIKMVITMVETDLLPRVKKTATTVENILATVNAKQKEWQR